MQKKTKKRIGYVILAGALIAAAITYYLFNMPQRDVQAAKTDFSLSASQVVKEYLTDSELANSKYLQEDGDSKILAVTGEIASIDTDQNNQKVVLLKSPSDNAGVSCTFTKTSNANVKNLKVGQTVTVKGVIRSGAGYDEDLELYEDVIMEKCDIVN